MFLSGIYLLHDLTGSINRRAAYKADAYEDINGAVLAAENEEDKKIPDIIQMPLRLNFPPIPVKRITPDVAKAWTTKAAKLEGPPDDEGEIQFDDVVCGRSISTYPSIPSMNGARDGDPICDRFFVELLPERQIIVIADGCNWGNKPRTAAIKASKAFVNYFSKYHGNVTNAHYVARLITRAFAAAQFAILEGIQDVNEAGTTTLLGGLLLELAEPTHESGKDYYWGFIAGSVGDCKCFLYEAIDGTFKDYTASNRVESFSAKDCGGRLGPIDDTGNPDLRNFRLDFIPCNVGDILFLLSDGVHDNLDPRHLGRSPDELGFEKVADWDGIDPQRVNKLAIDFSEKLLQELVIKNGNVRYCLPKDVTRNLIDHCIKVNKAAAQYMIDNPGKRLPKDYKQFPGKMDHTTCLASRVGVINKLYPEGCGPSVKAVQANAQNYLNGVSNGESQKENREENDINKRDSLSISDDEKQNHDSNWKLESPEEVPLVKSSETGFINTFAA